MCIHRAEPGGILSTVFDRVMQFSSRAGSRCDGRTRMMRSGMGAGMAKDKQPSGLGERPRGGRAKSVAELIPGVGQAAFKRFGFIQFQDSLSKCKL